MKDKIFSGENMETLQEAESVIPLLKTNLTKKITLNSFRYDKI